MNCQCLIHSSLWATRDISAFCCDTFCFFDSLIRSACDIFKLVHYNNLSALFVFFHQPLPTNLSNTIEAGWHNLRKSLIRDRLEQFITVLSCGTEKRHSTCFHLHPHQKPEAWALPHYVRAYQWAVSVGLEAEAALQHTELLHSGDSGAALKPYITLPFTQGQIYHTITEDSTQGHPHHLLHSSTIPQHPTIFFPSSTTLYSSSGPSFF